MTTRNAIVKQQPGQALVCSSARICLRQNAALLLAVSLCVLILRIMQ